MAGRNCYVVLCVFFVVMIPIGAIIALAMCGVHIAAPALQGIRMLPTTCTVVSSGMVGGDVGCRCGGTRSHPCFSKFPCLQINVTYLTDSGVNLTSLLVDTQAIMGDDPQCATRPCARDSTLIINSLSVSSYRRSWGQEGMTYPCYYEDGNEREVSRTVVNASKWLVFHALFWPMLILVLSYSLGYMFCWKCLRLEQ
ncbi:calcium-activated potassium channel subunit beta-3-like [Branchiostoma floridae x Branchiostoma belcheri]